MASNSKKNRKSSGSGSVAVGIISFLLGFIFALIVLVGSIFGVGYVAATTDINEVFRIFGLENVNENSESDDDKYNYINADTAPNLLALIEKIKEMASNDENQISINILLGQTSIDMIDYLAPITDTVLDFAYEYIDEVVDLDKETFRNVYLTDVMQVLEKSVYYIRTSKMVELLDSKLDYKINDSIKDSLILQHVINGIEAQYATVAGMGNDFKLPVLFDYYVEDEGIGYARTIPVNGISAYPDGLSTEYATETMSSLGDNTLYKVYYVPCKLTPTGIEEAEYIPTEKELSDSTVSYVKDGVTYNLKYKFRTIEYGEDTVFIAVKPQTVDGVETFVLDPATIESDDIYYEDYARNYYTGPQKIGENDGLYGITTINNINYFRNVAGEVIEYDPLTVADIMIDATAPLSNVPVYTIVDEQQKEVVRNVLGNTSLYDLLNGVNFNSLINDIYLSTFLPDDVSVTDKVMSYIVFNISNVTDDGHGNYTAIYDKGGENETTVTLEVEGGKIKSVKDSDSDETLKGNTVGNLNQLTVKLTLDVFLDVKADDAIMAYLGYGIKDVVEVSDKYWKFEGKDTHGNKVFVYTDASGLITKVTYENGNTISGTAIDEVSDRVDGIMDVISIPDLMDINPEEAIMVYLGYGVYDVEAKSSTDGNGKNYTYVATYKEGENEIPVYISTKTVDAEQVIDSVWKADGTIIGGTKANDVSNLLNDVDQALSVTEFIDVKATDAIMTYVGYGVYGIESTAGGYVGKYEKEGVELSVSITVDASDIITSVVDENGDAVSGTKIGEMPDRISTLQDKLTIGDIIEVDSDSSLVLQAIADSTISGLNDKINTLTIGDVVEVTDSSSRILQALKDTTINGLDDKINTLTIGDVVEVTDSSSKILQALKDTTINGLNDKINTLTIGEIVEVDEGSSKILQALKDTTINGLDDKINTLTIGEIVEVDDDSSMILKALKDTTINGLDAKINTLTVKEVLTDEQINGNSVLPQLKDTLITELGTEIDKVLIQRIYAKEVYGLAEDGDPTDNATYNSAYLYYERTGNETDGYTFKIVDINCLGLEEGSVAYDNALGKLTAEQFTAGAGKYYTYGEAKGMWKLVLYRVQDDGSKTEKAYTLNNFDYMVNACAQTVYNSTLNELADAGIIDSSTVNLEKTIKTVDTGDPYDVGTGTINYEYVTVVDGSIALTSDSAQAKAIGELSLKQLLSAITMYL
ncbi:MAG: hypothetical protein ACI4VK_02920 [Candidatus Coproplasma sp.]